MPAVKSTIGECARGLRFRLVCEVSEVAQIGFAANTFAQRSCPRHYALARRVATRANDIA